MTIFNTPTTEKELFQLERLLESCEDDAELAREVVEDFLQSTPQILARLRQALADGDAIQARLEAHSLKGSAQTLGGEALAWAAQQLEEAAKEGEFSETPTLWKQIENGFHQLEQRLREYLKAT
jgi:two-component system sensor histidine kinase/response regulator